MCQLHPVIGWLNCVSGQPNHAFENVLPATYLGSIEPEKVAGSTNWIKLVTQPN